jgi:hypothetical protein
MRQTKNLLGRIVKNRSDFTNMDKEQSIQTIVDECESMTGFLIQLRGNGKFDAHKFQRLTDAIGVYSELENKDVISRRVAGCLFYLVEILWDQAHYIEKRDLPEKTKVRNAHAEIWELVADLYAYP